MSSSKKQIFVLISILSSILGFDSMSSTNYQRMRLLENIEMLFQESAFSSKRKNKKKKKKKRKK